MDVCFPFQLHCGVCVCVCAFCTNCICTIIFCRWIHLQMLYLCILYENKSSNTILYSTFALFFTFDYIFLSIIIYYLLLRLLSCSWLIANPLSHTPKSSLTLLQKSEGYSKSKGGINNNKFWKSGMFNKLTCIWWSGIQKPLLYSVYSICKEHRRKDPGGYNHSTEFTIYLLHSDAF